MKHALIFGLRDNQHGHKKKFKKYEKNSSWDLSISKLIYIFIFSHFKKILFWFIRIFSVQSEKVVFMYLRIYAHMYVCDNY